MSTITKPLHLSFPPPLFFSLLLGSKVVWLLLLAVESDHV
jgi:hypothetical protein